MKHLLLITILFVTIGASSGCYYDKASELYPELCDTTAVTFTNTIRPIVQANCAISGCHADASQPLLNDYTSIKNMANSGKFLGTISYASGFVQMPRGTAQLSDCKINQVRMWIAAGAPNN